jgi:hypothetical protein
MMLQRKLRTVQREQEMSQNQKSLEDDHSSKPYDDEFQIDLTLQKASSCSEEDKAISTVITIDTKLTADNGIQGVVKPVASADVQQQQQEISPPQPSQQQREVEQQQPSCDTVDSPQDPTDNIPKQEVD